MITKNGTQLITIFGSGYVGLVTGVCLADLGHKVRIIDVDQNKIDRLNQGTIPIYEPGLAELLIKNKARLSFSTDSKSGVDHSNMIFICVGTPQHPDGSCDLRFVFNVADTIAKNIKSPKTIVVKSTVPVGTGDQVESIISQRYNGSFSVLSNPEFLKEGCAIKDFMFPDRIVIGGHDQSAMNQLKQIYQGLNTQFVVTDRRSSELIKYASNAFLATKISFINSIANLADAVGADIKSISEGMGLDKRIGPAFLNAGVGYGGSCFPKDIKALIQTASTYDQNLELLESVERVNEHQKSIAVEKLKKIINLNASTIAVLGLAFKPQTDDIREAPSLTIIKQLINEGAKIRAWDPVAEPACQILFPQPHYCPNPYEAFENAHGAIITTEWDHLKKLDLSKVRSLMKNPLIIDGRNVLNKNLVREAGIEYHGIGY